MSTAPDTPEGRLAEYQDLFERGERHDDRVVLFLRPDAGVQANVEDLARREAACCPFLDYRVDATGDAVILTITNPWPERTGANATLDAFHAVIMDAR